MALWILTFVRMTGREGEWRDHIVMSVGRVRRTQLATIMRVKVTADGLASAVELEKSSNFERLDEAAKQAVARWRFVPARRGDEAIEASVIVPIVFRLDS
mgnify:CR=1 FL=1